MIKRKLVPFFDRIILKPLFKDKTAGGIMVPIEVQQKQLTRAEVIIVGPGKLNADTNEFLRTQIKPGDIVYINAFLGMRIRTDREAVYVAQVGDKEYILESNMDYFVQKEDELIAREEDL
jgi:co-chaperonin GroES (HSP10)